MIQDKANLIKKYGLLVSVLVTGLLLSWGATYEAMRIAEVEAQAKFSGKAELFFERILSRVSNSLMAAKDLDRYYRSGEQIDETTFQRFVSSNTHFSNNAEIVGVLLQIKSNQEEFLDEVLNSLYGNGHGYGEKQSERKALTQNAYAYIYAWASGDYTKRDLLGFDFSELDSVRSFLEATLEEGKPSAILLPDNFELLPDDRQYILTANPGISTIGNNFLIIQVLDFASIQKPFLDHQDVDQKEFLLDAHSVWANTFSSSLRDTVSPNAISKFSVNKEINIGSGRWLFTIHPDSENFYVNYRAAVITACVSLLLTGLFVYIFYSQSRRAERISGIVKRRTRALKEAHEELEDHYRLLQKMNRDVEEARSAAELANRTKSEFLATMSHELRTPLNAILGFSQLLTEQAVGPIGDSRYIEYSKDIHASGSHLLSLINDILDLAKLEAGQVKIEKNAVHIKPLVEKVINILSHQASEKGIELYAEFADSVPEYLIGDELRLRQILINLCSNAIKFTNEGSVVARMHAKVFKTGQPGWVLEVQDTGIGIPEDKQSTLFDRFTQVDAALSRKHGGVGLGLAICRELVDRMGGKISVRSIPAIGTTIRVHLPLEETNIETFEDDLLLI